MLDIMELVLLFPVVILGVIAEMLGKALNLRDTHMFKGTVPHYLQLIF